MFGEKYKKKAPRREHDLWAIKTNNRFQCDGNTHHTCRIGASTLHDDRKWSTLSPLNYSGSGDRTTLFRLYPRRPVPNYRSYRRMAYIYLTMDILRIIPGIARLILLYFSHRQFLSHSSRSTLRLELIKLLAFLRKTEMIGTRGKKSFPLDW